MKRGWNTALARRLLAAAVVVWQCATAFGEDGAATQSPPRVAQSPPREAAGDETLSSLMEPDELSESAQSGSITGAFLRMLGWAVAVVAAGAGLLLVLKRFTPAGRLLTGGGMIDVVARTSLSPRHNVYVLRVARHRILIVGASGDRMVTLSEIAEPSDVMSFDNSFQKQLDDATQAGVQGASRSQEFPLAGDPAAETGRVDDGADLQPYRTEIQRLKGMISGWKNVVGRGYPRLSDDDAAREEARNQ